MKCLEPGAFQSLMHHKAFAQSAALLTLLLEANVTLDYLLVQYQHLGATVYVDDISVWGSSVEEEADNSAEENTNIWTQTEERKVSVCSE